MKIIKELYGGYVSSKESLCSGDVLTTELLDDAVSILTGEYLGNFDKKIKGIKIKTTIQQYKHLRIDDVTLLFTNYFNIKNLTFHKFKTEWVEERYQISKTIVELNNKCVVIYTSIY